jgi:hypothetical protein
MKNRLQKASMALLFFALGAFFAKAALAAEGPRSSEPTYLYKTFGFDRSL